VRQVLAAIAKLEAEKNEEGETLLRKHTTT